MQTLSTGVTDLQRKIIHLGGNNYPVCNSTMRLLTYIPTRDGERRSDKKSMSSRVRTSRRRWEPCALHRAIKGQIIARHQIESRRQPIARRCLTCYCTICEHFRVPTEIGMKSMLWDTFSRHNGLSCLNFVTNLKQSD